MKKYLTIILSISFLLYACNNARFNSEDWKANKNRHKQITSLVKSKVLIGKSYNEVTQLLGKEDLNSKQFDSLPGFSNFSIQYLTGGGQMIDLERLFIAFDSSRVVKAEKYYD